MFRLDQLAILCTVRRTSWHDPLFVVALVDWHDPPAFGTRPEDAQNPARVGADTTDQSGLVVMAVFLDECQPGENPVAFGQSRVRGAGQHQYAGFDAFTLPFNRAGKQIAAVVGPGDPKDADGWQPVRVLIAALAFFDVTFGFEFLQQPLQINPGRSLDPERLCDVALGRLGRVGGDPVQNFGFGGETVHTPSRITGLGARHCQIFGCIDVLQLVREGNSAAKPLHRISQREGRGPARAIEAVRGVPTWVFQPQKPEPTIRGRADHGTVYSKHAPRARNVVTGHAMDIRTHQQRRSARAVQHSHHSAPKIAATLGPVLPHFAGQGSRLIRRKGGNASPARIFDVRQQPAHVVPVPPCGLDHANVTAKPGFDAARARLLDHHDQRWFHKRRSISRCGMPASSYSGPKALKPRPS